MAISPLPPLGAATSLAGAGSLVQKAAGTGPASDAVDFGGMVTRALEHVNGLQVQADDYARQAAVGELDSVSDYMIAATEAQLTTQLTVAVRNRAVEAFNDIMRMQV